MNDILPLCICTAISFPMFIVACVRRERDWARNWGVMSFIVGSMLLATLLL